MIQLIFDIIMLGLIGRVLILLNRSARKIDVLTGGHGALTDEAVTRRLEIAAGLREPDPEPVAPPVTAREISPGQMIVCMCGHRLNTHTKRNRGCTVAVGKGGCACEWTQGEVLKWYKGKM